MFRRTFVLVFTLLSCCAFANQVELFMPGLNELSQPMSYGLVYSYEAGTNDAKALYSDPTLETEYDNPAALDIHGRLIAYGSGAYKFIVKNMQGNTILTVDNYIVHSLSVTSNENPFGESLTQTYLEVESLLVNEAEIASLTITEGIVLPDVGVVVGELEVNSYLDMRGNPVLGVATATLATQATNLGHIEHLVQTATNELEYMSPDGNNASPTVTLNSVIVSSLNVSDSTITGVATGTEDTHAVNYGQFMKEIASITEHLSSGP